MNCPWHKCGKPIEEHKAGHQMDACVAAAVMGIPVFKDENGRWYLDGEASVELGIFTEAEAPLKFLPILEYSQSYMAVENVIDVIRRVYYIDIGIDEHGAQVQINRYDRTPKDKYGGSWSLAVESTRADTMPEAVCKAALILVKTESEAMDAMSQM